jgi:hypothetical protein
MCLELAQESAALRAVAVRGFKGVIHQTVSESCDPAT